MRAVSFPPGAPGMPRFRAARAVTLSPTRWARCPTLSLRLAVAVVAACVAKVQKKRQDKFLTKRKEESGVVRHRGSRTPVTLGQKNKT